jgi:3-polyprenyl-4-hydroxybenzoate decarboxylase
MAEERRLVRAPIVRIVDGKDALTVIGKDGLARRFTGDSADLVRAILRGLESPKSPAALLAELAELAGGPIADPTPIHDALGVLGKAGAVGEERAPPPPRTAPRRRLVLGLSGAANAMHAPALCLSLIERSFELRLAATRTARRFVTAEALESIVHHRLYRGVWDRDPAVPVPHLALAEWAELVLVWPASATTLARIARGDCSDLVSAVAISTRAPVVIAPSMNPRMLAAPAVQRNLEQLRDDGFLIVHPAFGQELAEPPGRRAAILGPAPPADAIATIAELVLAGAVPAPPVVPWPSKGAFLSPADWEAQWARTPDALLPWHQDTVPDSLGRALDGLGPGAGRRFVDLGSGLGSAAIEAARRGYQAFAVDVAPTALARARARPEAADLDVTWILADARRLRLPFTADVVHDRGLLHVLGPADRESYAAAILALTRPQSVLLLEAQAAPAPDRTGVEPIGEDTIRGLFGGAFELLHRESGRLGRGPSAPESGSYVLKRR